MRRSIAQRASLSAGIALSLVIPLAAPSHGVAASARLTAVRSSGAGLSPADVQRLSAGADQRVIVLLRNQYRGLPARGATRSARAAAIASDQGALLSELTQLHAPRVRPFHVINAVAATVSAAEVTRLHANPAVQAVVPDRIIQGPAPAPAAEPPSGPSPSMVSPLPSVPSACTSGVSLEPEVLQQTNTAFTDTTRLQAQNIVTGTGVTVAFIAEGLDPNNPDFIRPDGSPVFAKYVDFSGDGPNAPTGGGEAFGDASSIAAQGRFVYDVSVPVTTTNPQAAGVFVNPAYNTPPTHCRIQIRGMAPGASLIGIKAFGQNNQSPTSNFVQAIEYAVDHGANVLSQSFGSNPYPDEANDPISLADDAAVAAGVTVIASSGDAGTTHTIGSPATDPNVIAAGGTTQFRFYQEIVYSGFQLGNGDYASNNISSLSSSGPAQSGRQTVDVVAGADLNWEVCTPTPALYGSCRDGAGRGSRVGSFGGTSEAAPLIAGEAALVIAAYRQAHGGANPSPALVRELIKSTATDLNVPSDEQGAGEINSLKAVQAALSYHDANGAPPARGDALLVSPGSTLAATGNPGTPETFNIQVTNSGTTAQTVMPRVRTLGAPTYSQTFAVPIDPTSASTPTFIDSAGRRRPYVEQDFTVPADVDRLDAAIAWDITRQPGTLVRLIVLDPQGRYTAYSLPQGAGNGYGHVDVRDPRAGTYKAILFTGAGSAGYNGSVQLSVSTSNFVPAGTATPASSVLAPGATAAFAVTLSAPAQPGDENAEVAISGTTTDAGAVPIVLRSLVPFPTSAAPAGTVFNGTLTGGNARSDSPGQTLTYQFDVPAGLHDLDLGLAITDTNYNLQGVLVDPTGLPLDVQSTVTGTVTTNGDPQTRQDTGDTNTMQFFRRNPQPGRYTFVLLINNTISGLQTSLPFTATLSYNGVSVQAPDLPNSAGTILAQGAAVAVPVTVTNTGNTTKDFFADPRLSRYAQLSLGGPQVSVPLTISSFPLFFVPSEAKNLTIVAQSSAPTAPISMDILGDNGAPPNGFAKPQNQETGAPDIEAASFFDPLSGNYTAVASASYPEVPFGYWIAAPTLAGPYSDPGLRRSTVQLGASVNARQFDAGADSSTGDKFIAALADFGVNLGLPTHYTPLTLAPGQTGVITVTLTPNAAPGTTVKGFVYVDAFNVNSSGAAAGTLVTGSGDELRALPYAYTVGAPSPPPPPSQTPELGSGELLGLGLAPLLALAFSRRRRRAAHARGHTG